MREVALVYTRRFAKTRIIENLAGSIRKQVPKHIPDEKRGTVVEWRT